MQLAWCKWWGNENEIGTETDRHELEVGRVMTMVKFYSNFKLVRKVTLVDLFGFKCAHWLLIFSFSNGLIDFQSKNLRNNKAHGQFCSLWTECKLCSHNVYRGQWPRVIYQSDAFGYNLTHIRLKHLVTDLALLKWHTFTCICQ